MSSMTDSTGGALREIPIHLLGFGNVGQAMLRLLEENDGYRREGVVLKLYSVFDRGGGLAVGERDAAALIAAKRENRSVTALEGGRAILLEDAFEAAGGKGVLVDTSVTDAGTGGPGLAPARKALGLGIPVVFASKGPLVAAYAELVTLARESGARIGASAAVGVPLPSLDVGILGLRGAGIRRFRGVLNDTTNQILRDLESGLSREAAIERARLAGTLEEDPKLDLEGWDAAYKLLILARALWEPELSLDQSHTRGVSAIGKKELDEARSRRRRIRLIVTGERTDSGENRLRTEPEALEPEDPLYPLGPGEKSVVFDTATMGSVQVRTSRGGPTATAASAVKDVLNITAPPHPWA